MKFKRMCDEMTRNEIKIVLKIIFPYAKLIKYNRLKKTNAICVYFKLPHYNPYHSIEFLPDDVYLHENQT